MHCPRWGRTIKDLEVPAEQLELRDCWIAGTIHADTDCGSCGRFEASWGTEIEADIPADHRCAGHELTIDFTDSSIGARSSALPVKVRCSCGNLEIEAVMDLSPGN